MLVTESAVRKFLSSQSQCNGDSSDGGQMFALPDDSAGEQGQSKPKKG